MVPVSPLSILFVRHLSKVVFPAPLGPRIAVNWPERMQPLRSEKICLRILPVTGLRKGASSSPNELPIGRSSNTSGSSDRHILSLHLDNLSLKLEKRFSGTVYVRLCQLISNWSLDRTSSKAGDWSARGVKVASLSPLIDLTKQFKLCSHVSSSSVVCELLKAESLAEDLDEELLDPLP